MKFSPTRLTEYTDEAIVGEIRRVAALVGGSSLSTKVFTEHSQVGITTVRRRFGGWREALEAAGLAHLYIRVPEPRVSPTLARGWANAQIIEELRRVAALAGSGTLTVDEFRTNAAIGPDAVRARFGGWKEALRAAGLEAVNHGKRYTDEECYENLLIVWTHYGRPPKYKEMNFQPSRVGGKAYVIRWGTWNRSIHAFTEFVQAEPESKSTPSLPSSSTESTRSDVPTIHPEDRRAPPLRIRYRVLSRDRFRCTLCGRSPANDPTCELHVDHIHPFSKGGKTDPENLRTLCADCNMGKGDLIEEIL